MSRSLAVCIALLAHATPTHAQVASPGPPPASGSTAPAVLAGTVRANGKDLQVMQVHLVPDSAIRAWAPDCEARDSSHAEYVRLRRPARLAYEAAQTTNERRRAEHLARGEAARAAAFAAREPAARVEAAIVTWLNTQRATRTGEAGDYVFDGIAPGGYALYADASPTHFWFVPVTVAPGNQRQELGGANVTEVQYGQVSNVAFSLCAHADMLSFPDSGRLSVVEQLPSVTNRADVGRALQRRYPRVLRQAGVPAQVTVRLRIRADGTVDPETVEAVGTTMEGPFQGETEAAGELVAESMRFATDAPSRCGWSNLSSSLRPIRPVPRTAAFGHRGGGRPWVRNCARGAGIPGRPVRMQRRVTRTRPGALLVEIVPGRRLDRAGSEKARNGAGLSAVRPPSLRPPRDRADASFQMAFHPDHLRGCHFAHHPPSL
jgi:hypothetical protein